MRIFKNTDEITSKLKSGLEEQDLTLSSSDYIYIGYKKQLTQFYLSFKTPNTNDITLTIDRSTESGWESATFDDATRGFKKSDFLIVDPSENHAALEVGGKTLFWVRIKTSGPTSNMVLRFFDIVFSSEDDLVVSCPDINRFFPASMDSHILALIESRNQIVRRVNNSGKAKYNGTSVKLFNAYDFMNAREEVGSASNNWGKHSIFRNISDSGVNDEYRMRAREAKEAFEDDFKVFSSSILTLDENDNGKADSCEGIIQHIRFYK